MAVANISFTFTGVMIGAMAELQEERHSTTQPVELFAAMY